MLNILAFDCISAASFNFFKQLKRICTADMYPYRLKVVVCIVLVRFVAVKDDGIACPRRYMIAVFDVGEGAV